MKRTARSKAPALAPIVLRSGKLRLGIAEVPVHVLENGDSVVEVTSIETLIGLPESGLGAFLASLPGAGGRLQFRRSAAVCAFCPTQPPASHVTANQRPCCGACAAVLDRMSYPTYANRGPTVTVWGLPATTVPDLLSAFMIANRGTESAQKAHEILTMLVRHGLRTTGQNPEAADFIMAAAMPPRSEG